MSAEQREQRFGFSDAELVSHPTVYAPGLFKGKRVLVSGAATGFGRAIAVLFARLGADLVICGRKPEPLEAAAQFFRGLGVDVLTQPLTIRDPEAVETLMERVWQETGGLDVLVNNAGGQFAQPAIDFTVKGWNAVIDTNLNGTWYMMQQAARAGVIYMSKTVAVEWAPLNIRVNCLAVGTVESSGFENYTDEGRSTFWESNPMRRPGDVFDVAEATVYLAAPTSKFITGDVITLDGGQQLWGDFFAAGRPDYFKIK
jgi:citronellol/citronellal dehydrogenase